MNKPLVSFKHVYCRRNGFIRSLAADPFQTLTADQSGSQATFAQRYGRKG